MLQALQIENPDNILNSTLKKLFCVDHDGPNCACEFFEKSFLNFDSREDNCNIF